MNQYVLQNPGQIKPIECIKPNPEDTHVLVRIKNIGLCGSDIHLFHGTYNGPRNYPILFGHEWAGIAEAVGSKVKNIKPGDILTGDCSKYCGECSNCEFDKNLCMNIEKFGITIDGASADYILRDEKYLYVSHVGIGTELLCLTEPISVAAHILNKIQKTGVTFAGKRILILGGGVIGLSVFMLLKHKYGCEQIDLHDIVNSRSKLAERLGANIPAPEGLEVKINENDYTSLYAAARYDIILETTGNSQVFANSISLAKPGGTIGCVGMIAKAEIIQKLIVTKSLTIVGSIGGTGEFDDTMQFIQQNQELVRNLISDRYSIERVDEAFHKAGQPQGTMKVVLEL